MLYILLGENGYSRRQFLGTVITGLGLADGDVTSISGTQVTPVELATVVNTIPFLTPNRLVVVEGLLGRFEPRRRAGEDVIPSKGNVQEFACAAVPAIPTTTAVLTEEKVSSQNPLFKLLGSSATVKMFPPLRGEALDSWIREDVAKKGGAITPDAVETLVGLAGDDLWALSNEIDKLLLYSGGKMVQEEHVHEVVAPAGETNIFHLVDALLQRRSAAASQMLHELLARGTAATQLLSLVARQLRLVVLAKELQAQRLSEKEAQKRLGIAEFAVRRTLAQAREYSTQQLARTYRLLLETDVAVKTGRQDDEVALDVLVAELTRGR
ncbi:MAG: DNA polymerase III subunit delta [Chloroflexi bacterium]|nr:DNA polymerase III subunit delta [Chloroflexota bacterium]MBI4288125.1 DNA polymerase III subunit delta [Chloroflexota bacterium]